MATKLFDSTVIRGVQEAMDFMANVLESSTEYALIGKDLEGKILLWNEGARRLYGYEPEEVVDKANSSHSEYGKGSTFTVVIPEKWYGPYLSDRR